MSLGLNIVRSCD